MPLLRLLPLLLVGACASLPPESPAGAYAAVDPEVFVSIIGEPAGGALLSVTFLADRPVPIDPERPVRITLPDRTRATGAVVTAPSVRDADGRTASSAGYHVDAATARALAAGGPVDVEVSYGGEYHRHRASRMDILE